MSEIKHQPLTPEIENVARRIRDKPHETERIICALVNGLDEARQIADDLATALAYPKAQFREPALKGYRARSWVSSDR